MIILGIILLVIGFIAAIPILWTIGIILVVIGHPRADGRDGSRRGWAPPLLLIGTPPSQDGR